MWMHVWESRQKYATASDYITRLTKLSRFSRATLKNTGWPGYEANVSDDHLYSASLSYLALSLH